MLKGNLLSNFFSMFQSELNLFVQKYLSVEDSEDVVQDVYCKMLRHKDLGEIENPRAYLYQVARNLALDSIRRNKKFQDYLADSYSLDDRNGEDINLVRSVSAEQDLQQVIKTINRLPEIYRQTFILSRIYSKTYKEIALAQGISVSTVEKRIIKSLQYLRNNLEDC